MPPDEIDLRVESDSEVGRPVAIDLGLDEGVALRLHVAKLTRLAGETGLADEGLPPNRGAPGFEFVAECQGNARRTMSVPP